MRQPHFSRSHLRLDLRLPVDEYSPPVRTGNRLPHSNPAPELLPARHSHLALAPLNSLNQIPGPVCTARMTGLRGHLPSAIARHAFSMRRAFLSRTITAISGQSCREKCDARPSCAGFTSASLSRRQTQIGATTRVPPMTPRRSAPRRRPRSGRPIWRE
jgi:hypothetical protein